MIIYDKKSMSDISVVGGKGVGLAKLVAYGLNVPDFFIISAGTDINDDAFATELDSFVANLNCELFAVRSSSVNEDSREDSFAGQFLTLLDVTKDKLLEAVKSVVFSCKSKHVMKYSQHFDKSCGDVAVVVQEQIHGDYSGVMFTTSPYKDDEVIIESVCGVGESLVSGNATPNRNIFKKNEHSDDFKFNCLLNVASMLEKKEQYPLDIEWTCCKDKMYFLQMRPLTAVGDELPIIPNRQWEMYVYRDFCLFAHGVQRIASYPQTQEKMFGFSVPILEGLIVNGREFYSQESNANADEKWGSLDKDNFFDVFIKAIKNSVAATRNHVKKLKSLNLDKMDTKLLFLLYKREIKAYIKSYVPLMIRPDDYLYGKLVKLVGEKRAGKIASTASILSKSTYYTSEHINFLLAVVNGDVEGYLDKYEWIGSPLGKKCVTLDREYFEKRSAGLTKLIAKKKIRQLTITHNRDLEYRRKVLSRLNNEEKELFNLISEFVYLRTYTAENSDRFFYYIRTCILERIAERIKIDMDVLLLMRPEEVQMAENGYRLSAREISKRKSGEVVVISDGISSLYYTGKSYSLLKELLPIGGGNNGSSVLNGRIACMGEVCGKVKIINNMQQAEEFEKGAILVTTMTIPEITSAIERASGIITDEGGITCHAAIIAREYSVPCLVGTKTATSVLKDGMFIKLDCINGRVIILNN